MGEVHALPGFSVPSQEPVERIVEILEEALVSAKAGRMIGIAVVAVERDPLMNTQTFHTPKIETIGYEAAHNSRHTLMAGVLGLAYIFGKEAYGETDE